VIGRAQRACVRQLSAFSASGGVSSGTALSEGGNGASPRTIKHQRTARGALREQNERAALRR
jgi:hypothetical protein